VYPNEAVTLDRSSDPSPLPLESAFEQWLSFATGKHTWISVRGATLRGLVSARRRGTKAAWELDCLIDAADDDPAILMSLLDRVAHDAGEAGAEKIFLRVSSRSETIPTARRCGFIPYASEFMLQREGVPAIETPEPRLALRRWMREDAYSTYQLYNRCTPESVRRTEAATFAEWQAAREKIGARARQWVLLRDERIQGWLRAATMGDVGRFEVMADPDDPILLDSLVEAAISRFEGQEYLSCRAYAFADQLLSSLRDRGFRDGGEFALLAKPIAQKVQLPQLAPVVVA
jgi:hypothetical protein